MPYLVIGIGGASRSGKTTLAEQLQAHYSPEYAVQILHQDDFIIPVEDMPRIQGEIDWEHPDTIDFQRLIEAIRASGEENDLTIVEGFLVYCDRALYDLFDLKFFVEIDEAAFYERRREDRRYGIDADWYIRHTWESFLQYGQVPEDIEDEVVVVSPEDGPAMVFRAVDGLL